MKAKIVESALTDTEKIKPGFRKFYQMYKGAKNAEENVRFAGAALGLLGAVVAGAAAGVGATAKTMSKEREAMRDANLIGINNALDEIKKKL